MLPDYWAERALVEFGVSIGATSTGLLLLRMADPEGRTPVLRDFTFKQIFHVLLTGGGFFDVLIPIPLTATTRSAVPLLLVCVLATALALACHPKALHTAAACATRLARCLQGKPAASRAVFNERPVGAAAPAASGAGAEMAACKSSTREPRLKTAELTVETPDRDQVEVV